MKQDPQASIPDEWSRVEGRCVDGRPLYVTWSSEFAVEMAEGEHLTAPTFAGVQRKIGSWYKRQEKSEKAPWKPVPILLYDEEDGWQECIVTGIHSGTGHPIVRRPGSAARQESYGMFLRPLSEEQRKEYERLVGAWRAAEDAKNAYRKRVRIDSLTAYAKEQQEGS